MTSIAPPPVGENFENHLATVSVRKRGWFRRLFAFIGPAYLVSIGYMDPGNWATDIEGGARFGYALIWVLLMSNVMAVILQTLAARLGIVTGYDLAQGCRHEYPRVLNFILWIMAEIAIAATDLAEALGTIIGLNLLFGLPLLWGCVVTAFDTFLLLAIQKLGVRKMEAFIVMLVATIGACFFIEVFLAKPSWPGIAGGFIPQIPSGALYIAIGIIGATVMPHNLYLHSSLVQSRAVAKTYTGKAEACRFNFIDSVIALNGAFLVNAAILIMAAAVFFARGQVVTEIQQAHELLGKLLGPRIAPWAFGIALLAAGQSSTLTGTLSGQIVMEGFLNMRMRPWVRRLMTRSFALIPAVIVIAIAGDKGTYKLLILSQVILGLQLPFAVIPLVQFTSDRRKMGQFTSGAFFKVLAILTAAVIVALNIKLVADEMTSRLSGHPGWQWGLAYLFAGAIFSVLAYIALAPFLRPGQTWESGLVSAGRSIASRVRPVAYRSICAALEHAEGDADIISSAVTLAKQNKARLTLLHVVETPGTMVFGRESRSLHETKDEAYLEELAREIEERDLPVEVSLHFGHAADEIIRAVKEEGFDFLVLGSHGHHGMEDLLYGQTVSSVRHGIDIPVLIIRPTARRAEKAEQ